MLVINRFIGKFEHKLEINIDEYEIVANSFDDLLKNLIGTNDIVNAYLLLNCF
jgi:hypothetical protein